MLEQLLFDLNTSYLQIVGSLTLGIITTFYAMQVRKERKDNHRVMHLKSLKFIIRDWIDELPDDTELEDVIIDNNDHLVALEVEPDKLKKTQLWSDLKENHLESEYRELQGK